MLVELTTGFAKLLNSFACLFIATKYSRLDIVTIRFDRRNEHARQNKLKHECTVIQHKFDEFYSYKHCGLIFWRTWFMNVRNIDWGNSCCEKKDTRVISFTASSIERIVSTINMNWQQFICTNKINSTIFIAFA